jgi:hypothetical protein
MIPAASKPGRNFRKTGHVKVFNCLHLSSGLDSLHYSLLTPSGLTGPQKPVFPRCDVQQRALFPLIPGLYGGTCWGTYLPYLGMGD